MKKCRLFCAGWWPFFLLPLLLLLVFSLFQWRSIEQDILDNAEHTIALEQQNWAHAEIYNRGRELLITGQAPNQQARDALEQNLYLSTGTRTVGFVDGIAQAKALRDATAAIEWVDGSVVISGEIGKQTSIDLIIASAISAYGAERVTNQLQLSDDVEDLSLSEDLFLATQNLVDGAQVSVNKSQITINGEVETDQVKAQIGNTIARSFDGEVANDLSISVNKNDQCQSQLDDLLSSSKIEFASGKADINPNSDLLLNNIAAVANECSQATFEVSGHTDSVGNYDSNLRLSEQRAQAVVDRLVELQLDSNRFTVRGYGPNQPVADNQSESGKASNRRIEFNLRN